ncbi:sarcosine oxidase subunit gamma [Roseovarius pelagicus]|uniref:Sarcosine oxidase subunit gamma n=1 Tax=Roseovarius pelagicus TaxID=2980108 RepID=A0ABY6DAW6_9RHOB|nr:sarcosine oxidase subunit gamma family protein [Roseovarius pelagicus]UXX82710.1 sarcosine oxidase subunit gamma [Roseovarius pelagicus]
MADFTLTAAPPLAGYNRSFGATSLKAPENLAIVSIALPLGGEAEAEKAVKSAFGINLPDVDMSDVAKDKSSAVMRLGSDLAFVIFPCETPDAEPRIAKKLKGAAYTTDQTDVWCALEISGSGSRTALERICLLDLHPDAFKVNAIARTVMEHLGVIIARTGDDTYLLLSASSSAKSFLHAIETSIENTA